jgi:hypothetical protein
VIPDGLQPYLAPVSDMYDRNTVIFGKGAKAARVQCGSREQAELLERLVRHGCRGTVKLPIEASVCSNRLRQLESRLKQARAVFSDLAESCGGNDKTRDEVVELLMHWFIQGRERKDKEKAKASGAILT